ncbi:hypothetical protein BCR44DRAFT_124243 [Catenaria anguillulae PL171]|uniref:Protein HGH1 homolog n=1 Tax=Catenaria anguillulae PL171 TaxID=765915 RepID=A0A1Y2HPW1_9FUNG|nr:hypothetical protein BCR44DRAFT_124243 [Catenaria anguillulae PL171]
MTSDLASQLDELIEFLPHDQAQLRKLALQHLQGLSAGDASSLLKCTQSGRLSRLLAALDARLADKDDPEIVHLALTTLINLTTDKAVLTHLNHPEFLLRLATLIVTPTSVFADLGCMLMSNLTHDAAIARTLIRLAPVTAIKAPPAVVTPENELAPAEVPRVRYLRKSLEMVLAQPSALDQFVEVFGRGVSDEEQGKKRWYNQNADFHFLASVFANVSQHAEGRAFMLRPVVERYPEEPKNEAREEPDTKKPRIDDSTPAASSSTSTSVPAAASTGNDDQPSLATPSAILSTSDPTSALSKLLCFTSHPDLIRRGGITSTVKNVTFDLRAHTSLLDAAHPNYILHSLLTPVAPADLADTLLEREVDDLDRVPDWLLSLPTDHFVEKAAELRRVLVEALLVLATTRAGRQVLREAGTYLVIREAHVAEKDARTRIVIERVVDMLMRDESLDAEEKVDELEPLVQETVEDVEMEKLMQMEVEVVGEEEKKVVVPRKQQVAAPVEPKIQVVQEEEDDDDDMIIEEII